MKVTDLRDGATDLASRVVAHDLRLEALQAKALADLQSPRKGVRLEWAALHARAKATWLVADRWLKSIERSADNVGFRAMTMTTEAAFELVMHHMPNLSSAQVPLATAEEAVVFIEHVMGLLAAHQDEKGKR